MQKSRGVSRSNANQRPELYVGRRTGREPSDVTDGSAHDGTSQSTTSGAGSLPRRAEIVVTPQAVELKVELVITVTCGK